MNRAFKRLRHALAAAGWAAALGVQAQTADHFHILPAVNGTYENRDDGVPSRREVPVIVDLFFSRDLDRLRVLAELQVDNHTAELERGQIGYRFTPKTSLWVGRFHNPLGFWNTEHHHGHYFETSIGRPRIVEFEDEGGVLPIHLAGFLLETGVGVGDGALQLDAALGSGPKYDGDNLAPVDLLRGAALNKRAATLRLAWQPDLTRETHYGVFAARTDIPVTGPLPAVVTQTVRGAYANLDTRSFNLLCEIFHLAHTQSSGPPLAWPSYWAGHVQAEYKLVPGVWTPYARVEMMSHRVTGDYAQRFPLLTKNRQIAGVRWDFRSNQALKLQLMRETTFDRQLTTGIAAQWSALF
ncbi:MAG: hypothetical protein KGQ77_01625 [Betaproteobacteria bacterium]|nr:hypothetical protein [Betaproteobacteria bacterium]